VDGDAGTLHLPAAEFDDEQHLQPLQEHGVDGEQGARQDAGRLKDVA
jgi:hypothetical protein